jgi:HK97 family phage prohead protease
VNDIDIERIARAAQQRAGEVHARADRPTQRRRTSDPESGFGVVARAATEIRAVSDEPGARLDFHGLASAYETPYEMWDFWGPYVEVVAAGAGAKSLARTDLDVPLVLQHQSLRRIARTNNEDSPLFLKETDEGLDVAAPSLNPNDHDVQYIASKIETLLIDEMSFMFRITRGQWSPDYSEYRIEEYDIHRGDVAIVGYGANPHTYTELRAAQAETPPPAKRGLDLISLDEIRSLPQLPA